MATKLIYTLGCIFLAYETDALPVIMSEDKVISFPDDQMPLPPGHTQTWVWRRDTGVWGVKFLEVKLGPDDQLLVDDNHDTPRINPHAHLPNNRLDTTGPFLNITFKAGTSSFSGRYLKLDVRGGRNQLEVDAAFLNHHTTHPTQTQDVPILPLLIAIVTIVVVLFIVVIVVFVCHRRRRQRQQVSLSVNVQGGIRRDSGIRYTRKTSTQSQVEEPASPTRKTSQLSRSNSNRSWMVRADLTATALPSTSISRNGSCSNDGYLRATPNWYIPTDDMVKGQCQMKPEVRSGIDWKGQGPREPIRKLSTLDHIPEGSGLMVVPATPRETPQDDGYLGPTPASSYLSMGNGKTNQNIPPGQGCPAGYENITVTGIIGV